jgi:anti-sigma B factor antagonist/stage II sporulation protein AA (anti-sigma F factor antagonist)
MLKERNIRVGDSKNTKFLNRTGFMANMEGSVSIKEEVKGDILVLRLSGRLDAVSSPNAERKVFDFINNGQHKLLLDFSGVDYLSSAGMRMLLSVTKKLKTLSGKLVLFSVVPNVMDVLKMSGFDHVLELVKTEEDGLRKF